MGFHCKNYCEEIIEASHCLYKEAGMLYEEADKMSEKAVHELREAIYAIEKSAKAEEHANAKIEEGNHLIRTSNCDFGCNIDCCECYCILQKIMKLSHANKHLESEALAELECALIKLEKAHHNDDEIEELVQKYIACIHNPLK